MGEKIGIDAFQLAEQYFSGQITNVDRASSTQALPAATIYPNPIRKGALLKIRNLIANADGIKEWFKINEEDRFMVILPLHHINSTSFTLASLVNLTAAQSSDLLHDTYAKAREDVADHMTPEQVAEAQRRAREWAPTPEP